MMRTLSRRTLATALPAAALLVHSAKADGRDAVLLARVDDFVALVMEERAMLAGLSDEDRATAYAYLRKLAREGKQTVMDRRSAAIAKLPAHTPEGLRAKARAAIWQAGGDDTALPRILIGDALLTSVLADLTGIPARATGAGA